MFTHSSKGWLIGLTIMLAGAVWAADQNEVSYEASSVESAVSAPAAGQGDLVVAKADSEPLDKGEGATSDKAGDAQQSEKIEVTFSEAEKDILTKQALEKLDVTVESLEFANADLPNVIRIIGERLNINFIFDAEDISGKVTLRLHNIRLRDALDSILTTRKLAIVADRSGIFRIVPHERVGKKLVETKTEVIQLNWISAADVQKTLKSFLSDEVGKMEFNEESNTVIVTDVPPQIEVIRGLINQLDVPERQVMIEARLVDVNIGAVRELSTNYSISKVNTEFQTLQGSPASGGLPSVNSLAVVNQLLDGFSFKGGKGTLAFGDTIGIFGDTYNVSAAFTALEERNIVEVLANPRVSTLNNVPAKIAIIEKIPYIQASGLTSGGTQVPTIEFTDAGVDIQVKPIITPNKFVRLEIKLKQMIFRERVGGGALDPPAIDERNADTNVIVENNNTVVLGGLRQQRRLEGIDGVPWLHRVPLFGWLFKDKNYDQSKIELILMMTPHIIESKAALTDNEKYWYDRIDTQWHLPDYFFDDVKSSLDNKNEVTKTQ